MWRTLSSVLRGLWGEDCGGRTPPRYWMRRCPGTVELGGEATPVRPAEELGFFPVPKRETFPKSLGLKPTKRAPRCTF